MDEEVARELVLRELGAECVITGVERISKTWVVSWESRKYLETGDLRYVEAGPGKKYLVSDGGAMARTPGTNLPRATMRRQTLVELVEEFEQQQP